MPDREPSKEEIDAKVRGLLGDSVLPGEVPHEQEFESKLKDVSEKAQSAGDSIDLEFDSRMKDISERASKFKTQLDATKEAKGKSYKSDQDAARSMGQGFTLLYALVGLPLCGLGIGFLVDHFTKQNIFTLVGIIGGFCLGLWFAIRVSNESK